MKFFPILVALTLPGVALAQAQTPPEQPPAKAAPVEEKVAPKTKRVLVVSFQQLDRKIKNNLPIGQDVADMMTLSLVNIGTRVVERVELAALERERGLQNGGGSQAAVQELGKLKGASVAVMGKITEFGVFEKNASVAKNAVNQATNQIGGLLGKKKKSSDDKKDYELRVSMDVRLVNVETGDILAVASTTVTESQADDSMESLFGKSFAQKNSLAGAAVAATGLGSTTTKADDWNESAAGQAARKAVSQLARSIFGKIPLAPEGEIDDAITIKLSVEGLASFKEADTLAKSIAKLKDISEAEIADFTPERTEIVIKGAPKAIKGLAANLQDDSAVMSLGLKIARVTKEVITLKK
ncbi:CsgG/HfaB family protein [Armatimonas rosea]|uniref:Curli biogenesis system outer membrane secretion channel CsgG n=1 Tax=Armatimonas rosea TaxID=685828 RepID=A0A7W9SLR4_ARMRO|nr:CsgG/HfaB family protein [Armatimonas rosea]MBB6048248.1 curli biogenesis system outer membrane secretion channel CsgG [Armatimonas rosea]